MADQVILLDEDVSMFGSRVRIALAEKGIKYEYKEQDLVNKSPLLLQMNPVHKKIPVLIHNGKPICESLVIVQYIDEVWNNDNSPLLLFNAYERAQARFWANYVDQKIYDAVLKALTTKGEELEAAKEEFIGILKVLEDELGDKLYFGGENFSFADIALVCFYTWFYAVEIFGNFSIESKLPKLVSWGKRCMQKETVSKSLSDKKAVYDFVVTYRKELGIE